MQTESRKTRLFGGISAALFLLWAVESHLAARRSEKSIHYQQLEKTLQVMPQRGLC